MGRSLRGELTAPLGEVKFSFRDSQFINLVARSLLSRDLSQDANMANELRAAIFPVLLCSAASSGYVQEIESLVKSGVRLKSSHLQPLLTTSLSLLQADLNATDYDKRTAMHVAAADGQAKVVEYLVLNATLTPHNNFAKLTLAY